MWLLRYRVPACKFQTTTTVCQKWKITQSFSFCGSFSHDAVLITIMRDLIFGSGNDTGAFFLFKIQSRNSAKKDSVSQIFNKTVNIQQDFFSTADFGQTRCVMIMLVGEVCHHHEMIRALFSSSKSNRAIRQKKTV
jgi:hypothetical protein